MKRIDNWIDENIDQLYKSYQQSQLKRSKSLKNDQKSLMDENKRLKFEEKLYSAAQSVLNSKMQRKRNKLYEELKYKLNK